MLKKLILSTVCATATLAIAEPAIAGGSTAGCTLPPHLAHLCLPDPPPPSSDPVDIPEPSLIVGSIVVAAGCISQKIAQNKKQANAE